MDSVIELAMQSGYSEHISTHFNSLTIYFLMLEHSGNEPSQDPKQGYTMFT